MNRLIDYAILFSKNRITIKNNHNGKAYIGCVIFDGNYYYSYGINQYNIDFKFNTIHAEVDAVKKLKPSLKPQRVNMIVFRINRKNKNLCMAKPCISCIQYISKFLKKKNYILNRNRCWYTDEKGNLDYVKIY